MKYAMYLRKSRADLELEQLGEGETLSRHKAMLEQLAHRHDISMEQVDIYKEVVSGESIQDRPEMQKLLKAVSQRYYKAVLVVEIERLARGNTTDQGTVADAFFYSGTLIITPSKIYDPRNEADQEYFEFGLFMSRREYKTIRRRLQAGKLEAVKEGQWIANWTPYGYKAVRTSRKDRHLEIVPEEAEVVKSIYNLHLDGMTPHRIARYLTEQGIPPPRNSDQWHKSTITRILQNPVYIGKIRWAAHATTREIADNGMAVKRRRKTENPVVVDGKHQPIISDFVFNQNQALFDRSSPIGEYREMVNPLSGLLRCLKCGRAITYSGASKKQPYPRYSHKNAFNCSQPSCHADEILNAVILALKTELHDAEITAANDNRQEQERQRETARLQKALNKEQERLKRIYDAYEIGTYTADEFISRRQQAAAAIKGLEEQLARDNKPIAKAPKTSTLHAVIDSLSDPAIPAAEKNKLLKQIVAAIWYDGTPDGIKLELEML